MFWLATITFSFTLLFTGTNSHSWVECVDYDMSHDLNADDYNNEFYHDYCYGYPRDRKHYTNHNYFGHNSGIDWELFGDGDQTCERSIGSPDDNYADTYDDEFPHASYTVGDTKRILWPAKNHAGYECQATQNDHRMQLYVNLAVNPTSDLESAVNDTHMVTEKGWTLVIDWHKEYVEETGDEFEYMCTAGDCTKYSLRGKDDVPFENCPAFCADTENAVCYGDFVVPDVFPEDGYYTFLWFWQFRIDEWYTHCFEVYVTTNPDSDTDTDTNSDVTTTDAGSSNTDTDTDNNTDNDDDNNNDDDESEEPEVTEVQYFVTIPIAYYDYDSSNYNSDYISLLENALDLLILRIFDGEVTYDIAGSYHDEEANFFNASIDSQELTLEQYRLMLTITENGTFCSYVEEQFNQEGSCYIGGDGASGHTEVVVVDQDLNDGGSSSGSDGSIDVTFILIIVIIIISMCIVCMVVWIVCKNRKNNNKSNNGVTGKSAEKEMANSFHSAMGAGNGGGGVNTQQNIVAVQDEDGNGGQTNTHVSQHGSRRPPAPPRPPRRQ